MKPLTVVEPTYAEGICGFCAAGNHGRCAIGVVHRPPHEKYKDGVVWVCLCEEGPCRDRSRVKCSDCGNQDPDDVNPDTWQCKDTDYCAAVLAQRRESNPLFQQLREIKEKTKMAKIENDKAKATKKAAAAPKVGKCLVTGEPTKGGLFKPGMDARYVSDRVKDVMEKRSTAAQAKARMKSDGVSEVLIAKFEKGLRLAQEKADKAAAAAKEKAAAKKATAVSGKKA